MSFEIITSNKSVLFHRCQSVIIRSKINACLFLSENKKQILQEHYTVYIYGVPLKTLNTTFSADGEFPGCDEQ